MRISLIVPIYNVEKYVERCLDSIINQTYKNIECIFVNDSSPDRSIEIIKNKLNSFTGDIHFTIIEHQENKGLSEARNTGIRVSNGDYILFLDSDDTLSQDAISLLVQTAQANDNPEIVMGITKGIDAKGNIIDVSFNQNMSFYNNKDVFQGYIDNKWYLIGCNKLIRTDIFKKHKTFFQPGIYHEDVLWSFEVSTYINKLILCPHTTYYYYLGDTNSISRSPLSTKRMEDSILILEKKACYLGHTVNDRLLAQHIKAVGISYIYAMARNNFSRNTIKSFLRRIDKLLDRDFIAKTKSNIPLHWRLVYNYYKYF